MDKLPEFIDNPNCDGARCIRNNAPVRVYRLGGGGNLILCQACWEHENKYNRERGKERGMDPANFPTQDWDTAQVYYTDQRGAGMPDDIPPGMPENL